MIQILGDNKDIEQTLKWLYLGMKNDEDFTEDCYRDFLFDDENKISIDKIIEKYIKEEFQNYECIDTLGIYQYISLKDHPHYKKIDIKKALLEIKEEVE